MQPAWLEEEFAAQNPGSTLTVEFQPWDDIVSVCRLHWPASPKP